MGFYVLGLTMLGEQFKGQICLANASFIFFLSIGKVLGPPVIGRAMDLLETAPLDGQWVLSACFFYPFFILPEL